MKVTIKIVLSILISVSIVVGIFAFNQINDEKNRIVLDLERRSIVLAESLKEVLLPLLESKSFTKIEKIVEKFGNRERLKGIAIFDTSGNIIGFTKNLKLKTEKLLPDVVNSIVEKSTKSHFLKIDREKYFIYVTPIFSEEDSNESVLGSLALFQDANYIDIRLKEVWKQNLTRLFFLIVSISIVTFFIIHWTITTPISQMTQWIKNIRNEDKRALIPPPIKGDILEPLINEVENLSKTLSKIRANIAEEEKFRTLNESLWTAERLKEFIHNELSDRKIFLVSNREPYMHIREGNKIKCIIPAGGLVTALDPVMKACGGVWIAHGSGNADFEVVDKKNNVAVPPDKPSYTLKRIWLDKDEEKGYYYGFSNEGLWPLCHITYVRPIFRLEDWESYQKVNEKFANALLEEIKDIDSPLVLIQDYHMALVPLLIKAKRPDAKVAIFWHIPWPNPEVFGICPWARELLLGMLGADLIGFHIQFYCNNFLETVDRLLESKIDWELFSIERKGRLTLVKPFPISIDFDEFNNITIDKHAVKADISNELNFNTEFIGIGVDRIDYTKGILERLLAIERFLEKYPEFLGRLTFIQMGSPSRFHIKQYRELIKDVDEMVERINWKFQKNNYKPILFLKGYHEHSQIIPFYKIANFCIVNSLHDGMNLVAKEFIASRDDEDGVLILSQFTGASRELKDAIIVNPYDIENMADATYMAITMPEDERKARMSKMRKIVKERNIYRWTKDLISALIRI